MAFLALKLDHGFMYQGWSFQTTLGIRSKAHGCFWKNLRGKPDHIVRSVLVSLRRGTHSAFSGLQNSIIILQPQNLEKKEHKHESSHFCISTCWPLPHLWASLQALAEPLNSGFNPKGPSPSSRVQNLCHIPQLQFLVQKTHKPHIWLLGTLRAKCLDPEGTHHNGLVGSFFGISGNDLASFEGGSRQSSQCRNLKTHVSGRSRPF